MVSVLHLLSMHLRRWELQLENNRIKLATLRLMQMRQVGEESQVLKRPFGKVTYNEKVSKFTL